MTITPQEMEARIVRYGELQPCKTAFIDAHTPGSNQKENFTIIGAGVSESPDQHVHLRETPGFNIGAAGQPPYCRNSLHKHSTAEVFFVLKGRWRFFWGRWGDAGEVVLEEGDIINLPTNVFRGFENIGTDYGMIMAVLGGDDAGGGVHWAPQVIEDAKAHGLILGDNGVLYDSKQGQTLPAGVSPMPVMNQQQLDECQEVSIEEFLPRYVARYRDLMALAETTSCAVIGETGVLKDRPGFEVDFLTRRCCPASYSTERHEILMPMRGHWAVEWADGRVVLNPGDTCSFPTGVERTVAPSMSGEASLYRIRNTDDPAGATYGLA